MELSETLRGTVTECRWLAITESNSAQRFQPIEALHTFQCLHLTQLLNYLVEWARLELDI